MGRPALQIIDGKKQCSTCKAWKDVSLFYPDKVAKTGLEGRCRDCNISRVQNRHSKNLSSALTALYKCHKRLRGSRRRELLAANSCVTKELLMEMWEQQDGLCAVTRVPMTHIRGQLQVPSNVSIDRIDPNRGYSRDNIRLVCRAVNYMKAAMTDSELIQWAALILNGPLGNQRL